VVALSRRFGEGLLALEDVPDILGMAFLANQTFRFNSMFETSIFTAALPPDG
jgi:hypothetical protein